MADYAGRIIAFDKNSKRKIYVPEQWVGSDFFPHIVPVPSAGKRTQKTEAPKSKAVVKAKTVEATDDKATDNE